MRLLTHNFLKNNTKLSKDKGYPLKILCTEIQITENTYDEDFILRILPTLNWEVLVNAATEIGINVLPVSLPSSLKNDKEFLKALHHVLINVQIVSGILTCPESGREFVIKEGVSDFVVTEEECVNVRA